MKFMTTRKSFRLFLDRKPATICVHILNIIYVLWLSMTYIYVIVFVCGFVSVYLCVLGLEN